MKPLDFPLLTDENIQPEVVDALLAGGKDVRTARAEGLGGQDDVAIIRHAHAAGRVVVTHDADFGKLAVQSGEPFTGIVYLRPGHIVAAFVLTILEAIERVPDATPPFILVAERQSDAVRIRLRAAIHG